MPDLALVGAAVPAARSLVPTGEVAFLGLEQFAGHAVDQPVDIVVAELRPAQLLKTVDVFLVKIDVLKHAVPPRVVEEIGATAAPPLLGVAVAAIGRAKRSVKVPNRAVGEFTTARDVHVRAESERIDVERDNVKQVMIDRRLHVDVLGIAPIRIAKIRPVQRIAHVVEILAERLFVRIECFGLHLLLLRVDVLDALAGRAKAGVARVSPVDLENVTAGHLRRGLVFGEQFLDIDPVRVAVDFLDQRVHAEVVAGGERAAVGVQVYLDESRARCVPPDLPT